MEQAYSVVEDWARAFNQGASGAVAALYAPGATVWGTLAKALTTSPPAIEAYFTEAARAGMRVTLGEHVSSRLSDVCVIDAGHYELTRTADGQTTNFAARYSFVLEKRDGAWMIAHHHSSTQPKPLG
jgi:uncharacterized protein (TIGR02246 family)